MMQRAKRPVGGITLGIAEGGVGKKSEPGDLVPCTVILYIEINRVPGCTGMLSGWLYNHANCMWRHNNYNIPKTSKNIL
jgi:hypothetical protein